MLIRKCIICKKEFSAIKNQKCCSGRCKLENEIEYKRKYKEENKEKYRQYSKEWRKRNPKAWGDYYKKNLGEMRKKHKAHQYSYVYQQRKNSCYFCENKKNLVFHHFNYKKRLGITLCQKCHIRLHKIVGVSKNE